MIPIIYCNAGHRPWTKYAVKSVQRYCSNADIRLISDCDEKHTGVATYKMSDYSDIDNRLCKSYRHMSHNPEYFELGCLRRWPIILDFVKKNNIDKFVVADWDILFCCDYRELADGYQTYDFTYQNGASIGLSYWNSQRPLSWLVDLILACYENKDSDIAKKFDKIWNWYVSTNTPGGISDMMFAVELVQCSGFNCFDTYSVQTDNNGGRFCWDNNMALLSGGWEKNSIGLKNAQYKDNKVICNNAYHGDVTLKCMHFASVARLHIQRYFERLL